MILAEVTRMSFLVYCMFIKSFLFNKQKKAKLFCVKNSVIIIIKFLLFRFLAPNCPMQSSLVTFNFIASFFLIVITKIIFKNPKLQSSKINLKQCGSNVKLDRVERTDVRWERSASESNLKPRAGHISSAELLTGMCKTLCSMARKSFHSSVEWELLQKYCKGYTSCRKRSTSCTEACMKVCLVLNQSWNDWTALKYCIQILREITMLKTHLPSRIFWISLIVLLCRTKISVVLGGGDAHL